VKGHKVQLEQVILNLFNNSFDAIEFLGDKWIEVSCHQRNGKIQLYFKDSGHGIPPEIASRIMEPFFSTKEPGQGMGLGLFLVRTLAMRLGGDLRLSKLSPNGTQAMFTILYKSFAAKHIK
jgi:C4-dicarboxylate-specific signal transduction histidine kinase